MTSTKYQKAALSLLFTTLLSPSLRAVEVPASEVPNACDWVLDARCSVYQHYERIDQDPVIVNEGSRGREDGGKYTCDSCDSDSPATCSTELSANFTQSFEWEINGELERDFAVVKAKLGGKIGGSKGDEAKYTTTCSVTSPPRSKILTTCYQDIVLGKQARMTHEYTCYLDILAGPSDICHVGTSSQPGGTRVSVGTGNIGTLNGGCKTTDFSCNE